MRLSKPLVQFKNFMGLRTDVEAGLVPDSQETGVFASELQNVEMRDGTINFLKGYSKEDDGSSNTTQTNATADTPNVGSFSFKNLGGDQVTVLISRDNWAYVFNANTNNYDKLLRVSVPTSSAAARCDYTYLLNSSALSTSEKVLAFWSMYYADTSFTHTVWNGAQSTFSSATATTITITGSATLFTSGSETGVGRPFSRQLIVDGVQYGYTARAGSTFTGVTPDPTTGGHVANQSKVYQRPYDNFYEPTNEIGAAPSFFRLYGGRMVYAAADSTKVVMSKPGDPLDCSTTGAGGRIIVNVGDGEGPVTGLSVFKDHLIVHKVNGYIPIRVAYDGSSENTYIKPFVASKNIGIQQSGAQAVADDGVFVWAKDGEIRRLTNEADGTDIISSVGISDQILPTLIGFSTSMSRGVTYKGNVFFSAASPGSAVNDTVVEFDRARNVYYFHRKPVNDWYFNDDGDLYFISSIEAQNYKWEDTFSDDDSDTSFLWRSGRHSFGEEFRKKKLNLFGVHLRMSTNTTITVDIDYGPLGALRTTSFNINGDGSSTDSGLYIISQPISSTYGQNSYGIIPYGSNQTDSTDEGLVEVIAFKTLPINTQPFDVTVQFTADGEGQRAKILSYGFGVDVREEVPKKMVLN